jgi:hypothetical protein
MFENLDWTALVSIVLGLIATVAGGFWLKAKGKLTQLYQLGKEVVDVVNATDKALADNKLTKEEVAQIAAEGKEVKAAFKALIGK